MLPLMHTKDPLHLQGPEAFNAGRCPLPNRGHYLHFAVHHDRPISVSILDRWWGREKLSKEAVTIEEREESYILGYHRIRPSEGFKQTFCPQTWLSRDNRATGSKKGSTFRAEPAVVLKIPEISVSDLL